MVVCKRIFVCFSLLKVCDLAMYIKSLLVEILYLASEIFNELGSQYAMKSSKLIKDVNTSRLMDSAHIRLSS